METNNTPGQKPKISDKSKSNAVHCLNQIASKTFDQETVHGLLMAVREVANAGSLTREIADFVAHTERDRGAIMKHANAFEMSQTRDGTKTRIHINIPLGANGDNLIKDLAATISNIGLDANHIHNNKEELLVCYFAILHLATVVVKKGKAHLLKISDTDCSSDNGTVHYLSLMYVDTATGWSGMVFYSDIQAEHVLGQVRLNKLDFKTALRAVRQNNALCLIAV